MRRYFIADLKERFSDFDKGIQILRDLMDEFDGYRHALPQRRRRLTQHEKQLIKRVMKRVRNGLDPFSHDFIN